MRFTNPRAARRSAKTTRFARRTGACLAAAAWAVRQTHRASERVGTLSARDRGPKKRTAQTQRPGRSRRALPSRTRALSAHRFPLSPRSRVSHSRAYRYAERRTAASERASRLQMYSSGWPSYAVVIVSTRVFFFLFSTWRISDWTVPPQNVIHAFFFLKVITRNEKSAFRYALLIMIIIILTRFLSLLI